MDGDVFSCQRCVTSIQTERSCLLHRSWEKDLGETSAIYHYWELEVMVCKSMRLTLCIPGFPRLVSAGCEEMVFDPNQSMHEAEIRDRIRPSYLIGFVFQNMLYIYTHNIIIYLRAYLFVWMFLWPPQAWSFVFGWALQSRCILSLIQLEPKKFHFSW